MHREHKLNSPMVSSNASPQVVLLWKKYFVDPSEWSDHVKIKAGLKYPDFIHKITKESLWIYNEKNPCWVFEEMKKRAMTNKEIVSENEKNFSNVDYKECVACAELLKTCSRKKDLAEGTRVHEDILKKGLLGKYPSIGSNLVNMYAKCGALAKAQHVHDELLVRSVVSWNSLIAGYTQQGQGENALHCFDSMERDGFSADAITFTCVLKACGSTRAIDKGKQIHWELVSRGLLRKDPLLGTALVDMYSKCGEMGKASQVFDELPVQDVVSWNALISGYAQQGQGEDALTSFERMESNGVSPNMITFTCVLKACGITGEIEKGKQIHDEIASKGLLGKDNVLGTALVDMYAKCGNLGKAQHVFDEIPIRDVIAWNTLIAGYAQHGQAEYAMHSLGQMRKDGFSPDAITFNSILKACGSIKALDKGKQVHEEIESMGLLQKHAILGNGLVDMYAKCGEIVKAQEVFDELCVQDVVSWNSLISGYVQVGLCEEALNCFERMQRDNISPNVITFICILKACGCIGAIDVGKKIHDDVVHARLVEKDSVLGTALVDMYAKSGELGEAYEVFKMLPMCDIVTWSALITGYAQQGLGHEALDCFNRMQNEGLSTDAVTFVSTLKACGNEGNIGKGKQIHQMIISEGLLKEDTVLGNALVDMYAKCGELHKAKQVLEELPSPGVVSWNTLIAGYVQQEHCEDALICFKQMQDDGIPPNAITFTSVLKACGGTGALAQGEIIHNEIVNKRLLEKHFALGNALVDMYAKCGAVEKAQEVQDELPIRDAVSWSAVIAGYTQQGLGQEALNSFKQMRSEGVSPDPVIFSCVLKACGSIRLLDKGKRIHDEIMSTGLFGKDASLGTALIDMYAKCGEMEMARTVFEELPERGIVPWNALISGYAERGYTEDAMNCFKKLESNGLSPNEVTFACIMKVCATTGSLEMARQIHDEIENRGLLEKSSMLGNCLVDLYAKCGELNKAQRVFDKLATRDIVSWNALIMGYAQQGQSDEALDYFERMREGGCHPDVITFTSVLKACGNKGAVDKGKQIHDEIVSTGLLEQHVVLGNSLVDMYAKCGMLEKAQQVFNELPIRDVVSWNALIAGYAERGHGDEALKCFECMKCGNILPDAVTFVCVLSACSHSGLMDEGQLHFTDMTEKYGITPDIQHETCMVDLFGRVGHFDKAMALIEKMHSVDYPVWCSLLGACEKWGNVTLGRLAFREAARLGNSNAAGAYTCMANIYAAAGLVDDAKEIEAMRLSRFSC